MVATVFCGDRSERPYLILFAYHGMDFWRDGGCGLNDQILLPIGNIFCGLASDRTTTKRPSFVYHGIHFCAVVAIDCTTTETTRNDADNGKRTRPPTRPHETVAVSPFSAITFQLRPWVQGVKISL